MNEREELEELLVSAFGGDNRSDYRCWKIADLLWEQGYRREAGK